MTRTRAATSVSLTIGAAFATLVVAGGILAGPAILDCSRNPDGIGACLRGKLDQSGVLAPQPTAEPSVVPAVVSEPVPHSPGWIEANATEYEPPAPGIADLHGPAGAIGAAGRIASNGSTAADVAMVPGPQLIGGGGSVTSKATVGADVAMVPGPQVMGGGVAFGAGGSSTAVALAEPSGQLGVGGGKAEFGAPAKVSLAPAKGQIIVSGGESATSATADIIALEAPTGSLSVTGAEGPGLNAGAPADASSMPLPDVGGEVGSMPIAGGVTLEAALQPAPSTPELVAVEPPIPLTAPPPEPVAVTPPVRPAAVEDVPRKIPKYNSRYPNVLVLPRPTSGSNSSFATLQVR